MRPLILLALTACTMDGDPTIDNTEGQRCEVVDTETIDDGTVPEGFTSSPATLGDTLFGRFEGSLVPSAGDTELLDFLVADAGAATVERRALVGEDDGLDIARDCDDRMVLPVEITFNAGLSDVTLLAEVFDTNLFVDVDDEVTFSMEKDFDDLVGTAEPNLFDPAEMAEVTLLITGERGTSSWSGSVDFIGESAPMGDGPDAPISATLDPWATFQAAGR